MNGAQRRIALLLGVAYLAVNAVVLVVNAASSVADRRALGRAETWLHVGIWEVSSFAAWFALLPPIWWLVRVVRPPHLSWAMAAVILLAASVPTSLLHVAVMVVLRKAAYLMAGEQYRFFGNAGQELFYEYRKDLVTYLQMALFAATAQWLIARAAPGQVEAATHEPAVLEVQDGTVVHRVPIDEIAYVAAAGNYVEVAWGERMLLHRATLATMEATLGDAFVRIHRGRLVRRQAVRRIETDRSGDFTVELDTGFTLRGSRRYRSAL